MYKFTKIGQSASDGVIEATYCAPADTFIKRIKAEYDVDKITTDVAVICCVDYILERAHSFADIRNCGTQRVMLAPVVCIELEGVERTYTDLHSAVRLILGVKS